MPILQASRGIKQFSFDWKEFALEPLFQGKLCSLLLGVFSEPLILLRSRGSTFRSRENPLGRKDSQACRLGNLLCARALVLVVLAAAKGCFWILEQPQSSCMQWHPLFQKLMAMIPVRRISIAMSKFGGPTPKRTYLYTGDL